MISVELERILQHVYADARARGYEFISLEHLLLTLIEQSEPVAELLQALNVDCGVLSEQLIGSIVENTPVLPDGMLERTETEPTLGFQRVLQRAIVHAQSADKHDVKPEDVLAALMSEKESPAVYFLQLQSVTRYDVLNYLAHGKVPERSDSQPHSDESFGGGQEQDALSNYTVNLNAEVVAGRIDPLIGRQHEMERLVQVL